MTREEFFYNLNRAFKRGSILAILGPRQCGKTTLARQYAAKYKNFSKTNYFDLEDPESLARLKNAKLALENLRGLIVIDEIQLAPDLFSLLRVLIDRKNHGQKYLILGSASRDLIRQSSETLAGRIEYLELTPFTLNETKNLKKLWLRGGFPRSYLASSDGDSIKWRDNYIKTFLERDIPNLGIKIPPLHLRRFWMMLSHYHGNFCNYSELGKALGISSVTAKHYLDILHGVFMVRALAPWFENISKRQVKAPKIYFRDSGILHSLFGIHDKSDLFLNPKLGSSWEGFAIEEVIRKHRAALDECFFWATQGGAELDLLIVQEGKKYAFEIKYTDAPKITKSMLSAIETLKLKKLTVIYPGKLKFNLAKNIEVCGLEEYAKTSA